MCNRGNNQIISNPVSMVGHGLSVVDNTLITVDATVDQDLYNHSAASNREQRGKTRSVWVGGQLLMQIPILNGIFTDSSPNFGPAIR